MKKFKMIHKIILGAIIFVIGIIFAPENQIIKLSIFMIAYLILGSGVLLKAAKNILHGSIFDENFLMSIATIGAFIVGEYPEGVAVMLFYQLGEFFENYAVNKSRKSIAELMDIRPDYANVLRNGEILKVDPEEVMIDEIIVIKAGERIPLDGKIIDGSSTLDTSALTGESLPREVTTGEDVISGSVNINGLLKVVVAKEFGQSTVSKILDLVENASSKKSSSENFITKFARYYTPIVVITAAFMAVVPPLLVSGATFSEWVYRALVFLVISCPCALVISVPLSFFGGIGAASKCGILVKGSNYLEALDKTEVVVFDKTGTLTQGVFVVTEIYPVGITENELIMMTAHAESFSNHPISISLKKAYQKEIDSSTVSDVEELSGYGVSAIVAGKKILAGNAKLMEKMSITCIGTPTMGTVVHVAVDNVYSGYIVISDQIKADSKQAITNLKNMGIKKVVMLTGDSKAVGEKVAEQLTLDNVFTQLLPSDKVNKLEQLFTEKSQKGKLVFVGDGINDAPVLARADIGIAMGGLGSDAAIEAADIVIMTDEPSKIPTAINISKRTLAIVKQNIIFALAVKIIVLILGALGYANMWMAVFADVGVSVLAILNALRIMNVKKWL